MLIDKSQKSAQISPIDLIGSPTVYTYIPTPNPEIIGKRSIAFQNVITINIQTLELAAKDGKPGIWLNKSGEMPIHVTMDDGSLFTDKKVCIEVAKGINSSLLTELQEIAENKKIEAAILLEECAEYESVAAMVAGVITHMK